MPKRKRKHQNTPASEVVGEDDVLLRATTPLQLCYYGNPVLRKKAKPVSEITETERQLAYQMLETLYNTGNGIGLAATQIGILKRLIIIDIGEDDDETYEPLVLFNPEILSVEGEVVAEEGCLSIPNVTAEVRRPEKVVVDGIDIRGEPVHIETDGLLARVLQHEIDHLNGVLFIDLISGLKRQLLKEELSWIQQAERPS